MPRTPSPALRRGLLVAKLGIAATLGSLAVGPAIVATQDVVADRVTVPATTTAGPATPEQHRLEVLMERHDCSATGLGADVIPGSALIERDDRVRHVSFDTGWAVFTGDAPGALLAVCRAGL